MTITDAEAIRKALIAAKCDSGDGTYIHASMDNVVAAILSYLASRRETQEPVAWRVTYADGDTVYLHHKPTGDSGVYECTPLYTAPPAPAGEVERMRAAIKRQVENIDRWRETGEPASPEESKSIYEQLVAAINGGCHD